VLRRRLGLFAFAAAKQLVPFAHGGFFAFFDGARYLDALLFVQFFGAALDLLSSLARVQRGFFGSLARVLGQVLGAVAQLDALSRIWARVCSPIAAP